MTSLFIKGGGGWRVGHKRRNGLAVAAHVVEKNRAVWVRFAERVGAALAGSALNGLAQGTSREYRWVAGRRNSLLEGQKDGPEGFGPREV